MLADLENELREKFPAGGHLHDKIDDNAHSHLISSFLNPAQVLPIKGGQLHLGTWQAVVFVEADGPRNRTIVVKTISTLD
jgi:secondary thiamine-phosphate synthase enzyme